jgi:hypothetical protein
MPQIIGGFGSKRLDSLIKDVAIVVSKPLRSDFFMRKHAELKIRLRKIKGTSKNSKF